MRGRSDRRNKTVEQRSNDGRRRTVYTAFNFDGMVPFLTHTVYLHSHELYIHVLAKHVDVCIPNGLKRFLISSVVTSLGKVR